jgi:hypothetical protein
MTSRKVWKDFQTDTDDKAVVWVQYLSRKCTFLLYMSCGGSASACADDAHTDNNDVTDDSRPNLDTNSITLADTLQPITALFLGI